MTDKKSQSPGGFRAGRALGRAGLWLFLFVPGLFAAAEPLYSPAWGFRIDLPQDYTYTGGDGRSRFSFRSAGGAVFDLAVYNQARQTMKALVDDTIRRLGNRGDVSYFDYRDKLAALIELDFSNPAGEGGAGGLAGWALCVELGRDEGEGGSPAAGAGRPSAGPPLLLALAYGPAEREDLAILHLSALDSVAPSEGERRFPGPVTSFGYPRGDQKKQALAGINAEALIREHDAEAAQALVDREYAILRLYTFSPDWQEAWIRFYRAVYRDSWDRLADAAFQLERHWNAPSPAAERPTAPAADPGGENRAFAGRVLAWVQSFAYERDLMGSDFVNLVSAAFEGRGDCDSRALLWAIVLAQADIPAAVMISREHSHAMGLGDLEGPGARFEAGGKKWLVAETTAPVGIGLIEQRVSGVESWFGVLFE
jgi:hypothetical protein